jgi:hypothetical protein
MCVGACSFPRCVRPLLNPLCLLISECVFSLPTERIQGQSIKLVFSVRAAAGLAAAVCHLSFPSQSLLKTKITLLHLLMLNEEGEWQEE